MYEGVLAKFEAAPIPNPDEISVGSDDANGTFLGNDVCNLFNTSSGVARFATSIELVDDLCSRILIELQFALGLWLLALRQPGGHVRSLVHPGSAGCGETT